jgi:hypothetical protein
MGCIEVRKAISRADWQLSVLSVASLLAPELLKSFFLKSIPQVKEMLDRSLPEENTVDVGLDPKNKSLYVRQPLIRISISNYIPRGGERYTSPRRETPRNVFINGKRKVTNTNWLNEWGCLLECYV